MYTARLHEAIRYYDDDGVDDGGVYILYIHYLHLVYICTYLCNNMYTGGYILERQNGPRTRRFFHTTRTRS